MPSNVNFPIAWGTSQQHLYSRAPTNFSTLHLPHSHLKLIEHHLIIPSLEVWYSQLTACCSIFRIAKHGRPKHRFNWTGPAVCFRWIGAMAAYYAVVQKLPLFLRESKLVLSQSNHENNLETSLSQDRRQEDETVESRA